jgi:hypothetical protein
MSPSLLCLFLSGSNQTPTVLCAIAAFSKTRHLRPRLQPRGQRRAFSYIFLACRSRGEQDVGRLVGIGDVGDLRGTCPRRRPRQKLIPRRVAWPQLHLHRLQPVVHREMREWGYQPDGQDMGRQTCTYAQTQWALG